MTTKYGVISLDDVGPLYDEQHRAENEAQQLANQEGDISFLVVQVLSVAHPKPKPDSYLKDIPVL